MESHIVLAVFIVRFSFGIIAVATNSLLIALILAVTPKKMKAFSIILLDFALSDLANGAMEIFVLNLQYESPVYLVNQAEGLCTYILPQLCFALYGLQLHSFINSVFAQPFSFYYRYSVLTKGDLTCSTVLIVCLLIYSPSFAYWVFFLSTRPDIHNILKSYVNETSPAILSNTATYFGAPIDTPQTLFLRVYVIIPWVPVLALNFVYRHKALKFFTHNSAHFSMELRRLQKQMITESLRDLATPKLHFQALTINALLPLTFCVGFITIFLIYLGVYMHPLLIHLYYVSVLISPAFSPLFQIYLIYPYRRAIRSVLPSILKPSPSNTTAATSKSSAARS